MRRGRRSDRLRELNARRREPWSIHVREQVGGAPGRRHVVRSIGIHDDGRGEGGSAAVDPIDRHVETGRSLDRQVTKVVLIRAVGKLNLYEVQTNNGVERVATSDENAARAMVGSGDSAD